MEDHESSSSKKAGGSSEWDTLAGVKFGDNPSGDPETRDAMPDFMKNQPDITFSQGEPEPWPESEQDELDESELPPYPEEPEPMPEPEPDELDESELPPYPEEQEPMKETDDASENAGATIFDGPRSVERPEDDH